MATETFDIVVSNIPTPTIDGNTDYCEGETLNLMENSGTAVEWTWRGPNSFTAAAADITIPNFEQNFAGDYEVVATNTNGCKDSISVTVGFNPMPTINISGNDPTCTGTDLNIAETGGEATTWIWSGPNSFNQTTSSIVFTNVDTSLNGTYNLIGQNAAGCTASEDFDILIYDLPPVNLTTNAPLCENEDLELSETAGAATTFTWMGPNGFMDNTSNPQIPSATPLNSGTYTVSVSDDNNCENTGSIEVVVNALPIVNISTSSPICNDENLELAEIGGDATQWLWTTPSGATFNNQDTIIDATVAELGNYTVFATDANGCSDDSEINVTAEIGEDIETKFLVGSQACAGDTLIFLDFSVINDLNNANFTWDFGNGQTSADRDAQLVYTVPGLYDISVDIQSGNCPNVSIQKQIEIMACLRDDNLQMAELNPTINDGAFRVKAQMWLPSDLAISIFRPSGRLVERRFLQNIETADESFYLPEPGTYFIHLRHLDGTAILRTIVIKPQNIRAIDIFHQY